MRITEIWSIADERIAAFFSGREDVRANGDGSFSYGRCAIRITPLPERAMGSFRFPQTKVEFNGPEAEAEAIHRRFALQFISAGG